MAQAGYASSFDAMHAQHTTAMKSPPTWPAHAWLLGALLCAVVLLQSLGLVHRTTHSGFAAEAAVRIDHGGHADTGWLKALFAGHTEGAACVLYDQLGQADVFWAVPALALPGGVAVLAESRHPAWHLAYQAAGCLARGPPARA